MFNGAPIDYQAAGRTPTSPELHHKLPTATHPHLVYEPSNFACTHARCNQAIGKKSPLIKIKAAGSTAQQRWVPASW